MLRICLILALAPCLSWAEGSSLLLLGSYSQGLGGWRHGEQLSSSNGPSGQSLSGSTSGPLGLEAQWLKPLGSGFWEAGASLSWRSWFQDEDARRSETFTRSEEIELRAHFITLQAKIYARWPLRKSYSLLAGSGLGLGYALLSYDERLTQTSGSGLETRHHHLDANGLGPAFSLSLGVERQLNPRSSLGLGLELGALMLGLNGDSVIELRDPSGNFTQAPQKGPGPLQVDKNLNSFYLGLQASLRFKL